MTFELALRFTEILLGIALLQQSAEHLVSTQNERLCYLFRGAACLLLIAGIGVHLASLVLLGLGLYLLYRFNGPYNGGSDRMTLLILICLCLAHWLPNPYWREVALGYLALQLVLSYVMSGWVKIVNAEWRDGQALRDVFLFSAYPVSEATRKWSDWPRLLLVMSWAVMLFELLFPLALLSQPMLIAALTLAALFHIANFYLFGLNRFVWAWLGAYPSILWLQQRVMLAST